MTDLSPRTNVSRTTDGSLVYTDSERSYQFTPLSPTALHDTDFEGTNAYVYVGERGSKHYLTSHDLSEVPRPYLDDIVERVTLLDNVDGGWENWDGRPEFSETYIDLSDATVVTEDDY